MIDQLIFVASSQPDIDRQRELVCPFARINRYPLAIELDLFCLVLILSDQFQDFVAQISKASLSHVTADQLDTRIGPVGNDVRLRSCLLKLQSIATLCLSSPAGSLFCCLLMPFQKLQSSSDIPCTLIQASDSGRRLHAHHAPRRRVQQIIEINLIAYSEVTTIRLQVGIVESSTKQSCTHALRLNSQISGAQTIELVR